jgi:hypothetical protein
MYVEPPAAARALARRGLAVRRRAPKSKRCCLTTQQAGKQSIGSGIARARDIIAGKRVNAAQVKAYFDRHEGFYRRALERAKKSGLPIDEAAEREPAIQGWWIWGGDPMRKVAIAAVRGRSGRSRSKSSKIKNRVLQ